MTKELLLENIKKETEHEFLFYDVADELANQETETLVFTGEETALEKYNTYRNTDIDFDCDVCLRSMLIYEKAFPFVHAGEEREISLQDEPKYNKQKLMYEIGNRSNKIIFRGDTMNSVATTLKVFYQMFGKDTELPEDAIKFIESYHTAGNFMVLPFQYGMSLNGSRGIGKTKDYFDLYLLAIYNWYNNIDEGWTLENVFGSTEKAEFFASYLGGFTQRKKPDWSVFIESNLFQDWVEQNEDGSYGKPKELWAGHFTGSIYPNTENEFKACWTTITDSILRRGVRIYEKFYKEVN